MFDKEYMFKGKHAEMVNRLITEVDGNIGRALFKTYYDVYAIAPIVGIMYNKKAELDDINTDSDTAKIFRDKILDEKEQLMFNYRLIMMQALKGKKSLKERIEIAFDSDDSAEERMTYDELYDSYVRGGVEIIYDKVFSDAENADDIIKNMYNFFEEVNRRYYPESSEVELQ